jgi:hypothetical protein
LRYLKLVTRICFAPIAGSLVAVVGWYIWTQEEILTAKTEFDRG